jgi:hypothetical protein
MGAAGIALMILEAGLCIVLVLGAITLVVWAIGYLGYTIPARLHNWIVVVAVLLIAVWLLSSFVSGRPVGFAGWPR